MHRCCCCCCCGLLLPSAAALGCDCAAEGNIGEDGAVAVAKALESWQCGLTALNLYGEADPARAFSLFWFCRGAVCDGGCAVGYAVAVA
eukprot:COSAG05_NODE_1622_length_4384_cov_2.840607_1_plen_89_part_00